MVYNFTFFLGVTQTAWLWNRGARGPLLVPFSRLRHKTGLLPSMIPFAVDAGSRASLLKTGRQALSTRDYAEGVVRVSQETGKMVWATTQYWPCSKDVLDQTKMSVQQHQELGVKNYLALASSAPRINWVPVLAGTDLLEVKRHVQLFKDAGINLKAQLFGIESRDPDILKELRDDGFLLHLLNARMTDLKTAIPFLRSADSMAWNRGVYRGNELQGQPEAEAYRKKVLAEVEELEKYESFNGIFDFF